MADASYDPHDIINEIDVDFELVARPKSSAALTDKEHSESDESSNSEKVEQAIDKTEDNEDEEVSLARFLVQLK